MVKLEVRDNDRVVCIVKVKGTFSQREGPAHKSFEVGTPGEVASVEPIGDTKVEWINKPHS